jgi:putative sugar O-methyltransferase
MAGMPSPSTTSQWHALTDRTLEEIREADELFRPTSFWSPGLDALLRDLRERGLDSFKAWPTATSWFYPRYGVGFSNAIIAETYEVVRTLLPTARRGWVEAALNASHEARRDFDAFRLAWNQDRWPCDLEGFGESLLGGTGQYFRFLGGDHGWTRPYLNYGLCLAALSQHVDGPPSRFLEIGGGFGALGEFVLSRDPHAVYVDVDIPPLLTVASWYLRGLFGDRVAIYESSVRPSGAIALDGSAVMPNYRLGDIEGEYDVFVNSFSFQEMEPDVVENYIDLVAARGIRYAVSLNSRLGKPVRSEQNAIGVLDPVTSARIIEMFVRRGFELLGTYDSPLLNSAGQLVVLGRQVRQARPLPTDARERE